VLIIVLSVCGLLGTAPAVPAPAATAAVFTPRDVTPAARPYNDKPGLSRLPAGRVDGTGVRVYANARITGGRAMNHPVAQAQYGLQLLNTYRLTRDARYLAVAARQAQRLVDTHVESRGAWWFPYPFDYPLSSGLNNVMRAPWYSAMAQGQATSLFARLADATGETRWRDAADHAFASLQFGYSATEPWATWRDGNGMLWLEEYPGPTMSTSGRVLNGHLFATYGVWDYWRTTRSPAAAALFDMALRTVRRYVLNGFRNPGWASSYGLRGDVPAERYHAIHINQLLHMHALTGDPVFATMAETLHRDFSSPGQTATIRFARGVHTGVHFASASTGAVTARRTVRLSRWSEAPIDSRRRIWGQPGYWYRVTAGMLAGYWVQEAPSVRATRAPVSAVPYVGTRWVRLRAGTWSAYTAQRARTIRLSRASLAPVSAIGWINGRAAVAVSAGALRGYWLPLTAGATLLR
jgi:D-glucuronyl C5-epimerase-like protein